MAVNVTDTVGANNTIILDSTSKIPAIDGSQITSLSGVAFTTGTIPVARLDIGTSAGKIVQLDGSAKIPALNGSNLTGLGPTKSTSDPTISTNPSGGVGTKWVNKSSGEIYICTDATAGANVWRNVGAGTDDIKPWAYQGEIAGFASGGHNGSTAVQTYVFSSATTAASSHGNLNSRGNMRFLVGVSSETHGYTMGGGGGGAQNYADKFAFASNTTATSLGSNPLPWANTDRAATAWTQTHGYFATGEGTNHANIGKITYSNDNVADDGRDAFAGQHGATGHSSSTHCYIAGGAPDPQVNTIQRFAFASSAAGTDVGDMTVGKDSGCGSSSATHGYSAGGADYPTNYNRIEKFAFVSSGNGSDIADLTTASRHLAGTSSTTHGYRHGGLSNVDIIERWSHITDGNSVDVGNLVSGHDGMTGNHY